MPLSFSIPSPGQIGMIALLLFGFGFVIFWHELGHFLAAKWVGIRVEQFAVGFGHAVLSWRKGIGFRIGNTQKAYRERAQAYLAERDKRELAFKEKPDYTDNEISAAADELGLGETEYRLNYIPLGGYVKMLGQDDLKPDALAEDPRAYNKKSVSARMLVISAGVIMNVILAAIGFMILFLIGFNVPPAYVGNILPDSPAQQAQLISGGPGDTAGLQVGDRILFFDNKPQEDFTKITLNTALVREGMPVVMVVNRPNFPQARDAKDFHRVVLSVTPARRSFDKAFLAIGFEAPRLLQGVPLDKQDEADLKKLEGLYPAEAFAVMPGDTITAINGQSVEPQDFVVLDHYVQRSYGKPIKLKIRNSAGQDREVSNNIHFEEPFNSPFNFLGIEPRTQVYSFTDNSVARGDDKLHLGDVIVSMTTTATFAHPTREQLMSNLNLAGHDDKSIEFDVLRDGKQVHVTGLKASLRVDKSEDRYGMGVQLFYDEKEAVIARISDTSPAKAAGLNEGDRILTVAGETVGNWFDVHRVLMQQKYEKPGDLAVKITYSRPNVSEPREGTLTLTPDQVASIGDIRYQADIQEMPLLAEYTIDRKTKDPILAAKWGVTETRDFILQFYLTLRRMIGGSVSPANMMGPVGIFVGGAKFAFKGIDWLLWFLCMISANLAVVNFLPIPVVDGGQFMFLMLEKIKGKPLSPRAMVIAQYVGLAFLAAVVLFVTYHDIMRSI